VRSYFFFNWYIDMSNFDLDRYRIQAGDFDGTNLQGSRRRIPRHQAGEWFVKGPIPGFWIGTAAQLPGKALHVALGIWSEAQMKRSAMIVFSHTAAARFGVKRNAARRALAALEAAGLIIVNRATGRCPRVTITECSAPTSAS
jgi:hypothetical protein